MVKKWQYFRTSYINKAVQLHKLLTTMP